MKSNPRPIRTCHLSKHTLLCWIWMIAVLQSWLWIQGGLKCFAEKVHLHTCICVKWDLSLTWLLTQTFCAIYVSWCQTTLLHHLGLEICKNHQQNSCDSNAKTFIFILQIHFSDLNLREVKPNHTSPDSKSVCLFSSYESNLSGCCNSLQHFKCMASKLFDLNIEV